MKKYSKPELDVIEINNDILTESNTKCCAGWGDTIETPEEED